MQKKKLATDILWSISALVMMNGVLQFIIYPQLSAMLGAEGFGNILYVMGILAIFAPAAGSSANNVRLILRQNMTVKNGDFLLTLLLMIALFAPVFLWVVHPYLYGFSGYLLAICLFLLNALRVYGDVEYRMSLRYKGYFGFYTVISLGYLLGIAIFPFSKSWLMCFLIGEACSVSLLLVKGHIFRPSELSENYTVVRKKMWILACSYLIYNGVLNLDRVLLQHLADSSSVTIYYVASLLGRTAALLVGPLNSVMIGYLTKNSVHISKRKFCIATISCMVIGGALYSAIVVVTPVFVRLLYPDIAAEVLKIAPLGNLSQIVCFSGSLLLTVMLTFCDTKWQLIIQSVYGMSFFLLGIVGTRLWGVVGFVTAGLIGNCFRFLLVVVCALLLLRRIERGYRDIRR